MKTAITKLTLGLSVAALSIGGIAYAQGPGGKSRMDADGDGVITRAEAQQSAEAMFTRMDVNNDGKIDPADRQARREARRAERFVELDTDSDGSISREEFMAGKSGHGDRARAPRMGGGAGMGTPGKGGPGMDGQRAPGMRDDCTGRGGWSGKSHGRYGRGGTMLKMADTNGDGAVSKAELEKTMMTHFDTMDADKDGKVTLEERRAARQNMKAQWKANKPASK